MREMLERFDLYGERRRRVYEERGQPLEGVELAAIQLDRVRAPQTQEEKGPHCWEAFQRSPQDFPVYLLHRIVPDEARLAAT